MTTTGRASAEPAGPPGRAPGPPPLAPSGRLILGAMLGGLYAAALVGAGLLAAASGSYPLAFGIDQNSDTAYPFPYPELVGPGIGVAVIGLGFGAVLVVAAQGGRAARHAAALALVATIGVCGLVARQASEERRCTTDSYSGHQDCTSATAATMRDAVLLATPAAIAIACLLTGSAAEPPGRRARRSRSYFDASPEVGSQAGSASRRRS